jgi:hypothetical protein
MLIVPEVRTAILRTAGVAAVAILCIVGAVRRGHRWRRILLAVLAIPLALFAMFGILVVYLDMQYGPR